MGIPSGVSGAAAAEGLGEPLGDAVVRRAPSLLGGKRVHLYEEGLVLGSGAQVRRWADVTRWRSTVDVIVTTNEQGDRARYTLAHRHLLRFGDGTEQGFLLDERRTVLGPMVVEPFENLRIRSAAEHIRKRVAEARAPALLDRIGKGRQVTFGPLTADAHGVFVPGGLLPLPLGRDAGAVSRRRPAGLSRAGVLVAAAPGRPARPAGQGRAR
ncbi:hypothetical protein AB0I51_38230 [Streptomyces sp. NPDC050549]|uniref:hypothetical protein n=1 Tax=Streptomyces sp. NPDC050549 TaxID=3155406 RepID=UPI00343B777C